MAALKRNLWTLCWLILLGGAILLTVILYDRWQSIYHRYETYHESRAQLVEQAVNSVLRTQELVLDVIGRELLSRGDVLDTSQAVPLLDNVLNVNGALIGFGLARPDGKLVRVSSNLDLSRLPNLRTHPDTAESFLQTLEADTMVLGRTYYADPLDAWTIPIRKALRDETGEVVAVMTAGLRLGSGGGVFDKQLHNGPDDSVMLFRETDGYVQYISSEDSHTGWYSGVLTTMEERRENRRNYEAQLGMTEAELKQLDQAFAFTAERNGQRMLTAAIFNPRYQLWIVSETRFKPIWQEFFGVFLLYLLIYLGISAVLLFLFRIIDNAARKRNQELFYHSTHDDLTGVLNRAGLLGKLKEMLVAQKPFTVVVINVDNFKGINDRYGQEAGDQALMELVRRLRAMLDPEDLLARLGGDEFVITTFNTDLVHLQASCQTLVDKLARSFDVGPLRIQMTVSVGLAKYPEHGESSSNLLRSAHLALYKSKQNRNSFCIYRTEMEMAYLRRLTIEQRLKQALSREQLNMVYQPQLDEKRQMVGLEALVRWHDEELGFVSPAEFVEVAEQTGLMLSLGRFVMDTSLAEYARLRRECGISLDLGINISVIQFEQPDFVESVLQALNTWGVPPHELVLEVTETLVMHNFDQVLSTVKHLQREGIRISMDDFGTGYSSLSLLRKLPIDELKIDKSFVDSVLEDERAANMIQSIIYIASSHNMHVVVEGVELEKQVDALIKMGCRRFQGYYFSRPERLDKIEEGIKRGHFIVQETEVQTG